MSQPPTTNSGASLAGGSSQILGLVLSGGGSRAAYQIGALQALAPRLREHGLELHIAAGSSIGAVNSIVLDGTFHLGLEASVDAMATLWKERTFRNTFAGHPSRAFLRTIQVASIRYSSPGPVATSLSIFDPSPLRNRIDSVIAEAGAAATEDSPRLLAAAVMVTVEGETRKPLLFVRSSRGGLPEDWFHGASFTVSYVPKLLASHGLASAALPSVLPPVELNATEQNVRLVDGGISDNIPVDPVVRLGAHRTILIDVSGRRWWFDRYGEPHDSRPEWELPAKNQSYCLMPQQSLELVTKTGLGMVLKNTVGRSTKDFITALGPTWPIFRILKHKMGEELAYEVMSYVALHPDYTEALIELGYNDTMAHIGDGLPFVSSLYSGLF